MQPPAVTSGHPNATETSQARSLTPVRPEDAIRRTVWGVSLVGLGLGLAMTGCVLGVYYLFPTIAPSGVTFAALGFAFLLAYPQALGTQHRRGVLVAVVVGVSAIAMYFILPFVVGSAGNGPGLVANASSQRAYLLASSLFVAVALAAVCLGSYGIQDRTGRILLLAGLAAAGVIQGLLWVWLNAALDAALAEALSTNSPTPLAELTVVWARLGALNAVPSAILLAGYERLYWQLRRRYFPHASLLDV